MIKIQSTWRIQVQIISIPHISIVHVFFVNSVVKAMMREILEIVMLSSLMGGLFFVKHEFAKDKQDRLKMAKDQSVE